MKKEDIKTLIIFIISIVVIIALFIYNNSNNKNTPTDRKVNYIFNTFSYDNVLKEGKNLFFQGIDLLSNKFVYETDEDENIKYYKMDNKEYKRIENLNKINVILTKEEVSKYLEDKNIIVKDNNYFILDTEVINQDYVGSIIEINNYDDKYVYFNSLNYYCSNYKYIGELNSLPECNYSTTKTTFKLTLEDNILLITSYEDLKNVIK